MKRKDLLSSGMLRSWEKFHLAVDQLATGPGDVRSRLEEVYFHLHVLRPQEIPSKVRRDFKWIMRMLSRRPARWEGDTELKATLERMRNRTGVKIAERIVKLYHWLDLEREEISRLI